MPPELVTLSTLAAFVFNAACEARTILLSLSLLLWSSAEVSFATAFAELTEEGSRAARQVRRAAVDAVANGFVDPT